MRFHRQERIGELIKKLLSELMLRELEFPLGTLATITEVIVSEDLEHAKIRVSVLPGSEAEKVLSVLKRFRDSLQYMLARKMNIRPMPQIAFELDHGLENAAWVEKTLLDVDNKEGK